jgi:diphosphomevalonate decarboxylase
MLTATAIAHPNIAFIKYWGNCEPDARIPANGSISMNLGGLETRTTVYFDPNINTDHLTLNGEFAQKGALERVGRFMSLVRDIAEIQHYARIESQNSFPMGAGIASSASAFAALALAASKAAGLDLNESALTRLARKGSGSACRSIPGGYVEWFADGCDPDSGAESIASPDHWDLIDCVAIVHKEHKLVGSTEGHALAHTSPLQPARVEGASQRLEACRNAILERDFDALADIVELDNHLMHAVMMTSSPRLMYWLPATLAIMQSVDSWRREGIPACYTIDAGPNVHVICENGYLKEVEPRLRVIPGVQDIIIARPGYGTRLIE